MFQVEQYVVVLKSGKVGRIEQWTQEPNKFLVEFNRDSNTREWFSPNELATASASSVKHGS
jgi:hypothetical protein